MNTAKVKTLKPSGCTQSFGSFELIYPQNLHGVIEPLEFETTVKSINAKCHSVLSKKYMLLFLFSLVGLILIISGFVKFANDSNTQMNNFENGGSLNFNSPAKSAGGSVVLIVIGFILTFVGCCSYGIVFMIFKNKVLNKIKEELIVVNSHFSSRRISWNLESEMVIKYIPDHEYNTHKSNSAYMQRVKFDRNNRPYEEVQVHFIEIQFPALPGMPIHPQFQQPQVQFSQQQQQHHHNQPQAHLSIGFGGGFNNNKVHLSMDEF